MDAPASVTAPSHYNRFPASPLDFIIANDLDFLAGNVVKYVCRHDAKDGLNDLEKARVYLDRLIDREKRKKFGDRQGV